MFLVSTSGFELEGYKGKHKEKKDKYFVGNLVQVFDSLIFFFGI